jgi:hypothetical protein
VLVPPVELLVPEPLVELLVLAPPVELLVLAPPLELEVLLPPELEVLAPPELLVLVPAPLEPEELLPPELEAPVPPGAAAPGLVSADPHPPRDGSEMAASETATSRTPGTPVRPGRTVISTRGLPSRWRHGEPDRVRCRI